MGGCVDGSFVVQEVLFDEGLRVVFPKTRPNIPVIAKAYLMLLVLIPLNGLWQSPATENGAHQPVMSSTN